MPEKKRATNKKQRIDYDRRRRTWPRTMEPVPADQWPLTEFYNNPVVNVWRSREFLAVLWRDDEGALRISVNRTRIDPKTGDWLEGITWDDLQEIKSQCGYGHKWACEIFPPDSQVVNVANMRHIWILPEKPAKAGWEAVRIGKPQGD